MFINMDLGGVTEPKPVPAGRYQLRVTEAKLNPAKEGKGANVEVSIAILGHDTAPNLRHFIALPKPDDDEKKAYFKKLMLKRFLQQFNIAQDGGFNVEDLPGAEAEGQVTLTEPDPDTGNIYNRLQLDRASD